MFSFCRHVTTTRTLTFQRFLSSTESLVPETSAPVNLKPFHTQLELLYKEDPYPSLERRQIVAQDLGIPMKSLSIWLINRRTADKLNLKRSLRVEDPIKFRYRESYTDEQMKILWDQGSRNLYPNASEIEDLAERLGVDRNRVRMMFNDVRARARRGHVPANVVVTVGPRKFSRLPQDKVAILEDHFQRDPFPIKNGTFVALVQELGLPPSRVKSWFEVRRKRQKENPVRPLTKVMDKLRESHESKSRVPFSI